MRVLLGGVQLAFKPSGLEVVPSYWMVPLMLMMPTVSPVTVSAQEGDS